MAAYMRATWAKMQWMRFSSRICFHMQRQATVMQEKNCARTSIHQQCWICLMIGIGSVCAEASCHTQMVNAEAIISEHLAMLSALSARPVPKLGQWSLEQVLHDSQKLWKEDKSCVSWISLGFKVQKSLRERACTIKIWCWRFISEYLQSLWSTGAAVGWWTCAQLETCQSSHQWLVFFIHAQTFRWKTVRNTKF